MVLYTEHTLQSAATATGDGTVLSLTSPEMGKATALCVQITGTYVGAVTFKVSNDGTNYVDFDMATPAGSSATSVPDIAAMRWSTSTVYGNLPKYFKAVVSTYTSGSITVKALVSWEK